MSVAVFLLALGATARLTRLINDDRIFGRVRAWALSRFGDEHWLTYWLYCPWCVSPYVGAGVFSVAWWFGSTPGFVIVAGVLSASWLIGMVAQLSAERGL